MRNFLIYTNQHKDKELIITKRIQSFLEENDRKCVIKLITADWKKHTEPDTDEGDTSIPDNVDCMIVLGGDGTMLQAARAIKKKHIPLLGVNLGTLGYMTEIEKDNLEESLGQLLRGDYELESRMMLNGRVKKLESTNIEGWALNDIVISKSGTSQIIDFDIYVNGQLLNRYSADGMIITTPTGSTGYNLSAGGPIVEPSAKLIVMTPICPHTLNQRSIILAPDDEVVISLSKGREGQEQYAQASFDGQGAVELVTGESIQIIRSEKTTDIVKLSRVSFLDVLHKKMSE